MCPLSPSCYFVPIFCHSCSINLTSQFRNEKKKVFTKVSLTAQNRGVSLKYIVNTTPLPLENFKMVHMPESMLTSFLGREKPVLTTA